ncbi:MAG: hypothetical protein AUJ52_05675 [Elusimicrobia bacterium CG1_02_63_36]|nr:MAG: hypothetical protein AUJ52_05675 [Elusimicrobia bacterium CG1_02_63_36]
MVRGVDRQPIFRSERDFRRYLDSMEEALRFGWVRIEARCLLMNHLHLLIESLTGEMWRYMHRVNSNFAARFNRIHNRVGHLFQGRFKSKILLSNEAVFEVGRYIHMNPVQAGIVRDPRDYRWSSMKGLYLNRPEPLSGNRRLRSPFSGPDGAEDFFRFTTARSEFIETADGWLDQEGLYETENSPSASPANASVGVVRTDEVFERVLRVVSAEFGIPIDRLINAWRDRHAGYAKGVTAAILSMSSPLTSAEIAERLRYRSPGGVRQAVQRIREVASRDLSLRKFINSFV